MPFTPPSPDTLVDEAPPEQPQSRFTPPSPNAFVDESQSQDAARALETTSHIPVTGRRQMADTIPTEQPATEQPVFVRDSLLPGSGPSDLEFQGGFTKPVGDIVDSGIWGNPVLPIPAHKEPAKSIPGAVLHAVDDAAAGVVNYLQSPQGLTEGAVAATPAAPIVLVKWARDMALGAKHSLEEIGSEIAQMLRDGIERQFVAQNKLGQLPPVDPAVMQGHVQAIANNVVQAAVMGLGAAGVTAHAASSTAGMAKAAARSFEPPPAVKLARQINAAPGFDPAAEIRAIQGGNPLTERIPVAQQSSTPPQVNNAIAAQLPPGEEISGVGRSTLSPAAEAALNDFLDNPVAKPPVVAPKTLQEAVATFTEQDADGMPNTFPAYKTKSGEQIQVSGGGHEPRVKENEARYFDDAGFWFPFDGGEMQRTILDSNEKTEGLVDSSEHGKTGLFISLRELDAAGGDYKAALQASLAKLRSARPTQPPLPPKHVDVTIQRPDGSTYQAAFGGYWEQLPNTPPVISRVKDGAWSTGSLNEGEKIVSEVPPPPEQKPMVVAPEVAPAPVVTQPEAPKEAPEWAKEAQMSPEEALADRRKKFGRLYKGYEARLIASAKQSHRTSVMLAKLNGLPYWKEPAPEAASPVEAKTPKPTDAPPEQSGQAVGPVATVPTVAQPAPPVNVPDLVAQAIQLSKKATPEERAAVAKLIEPARKGDVEPLAALVAQLQAKAPPRTVARPVTAVRMFDRETETGGPDILSWINENGKLLSKTMAAKVWGKDKFALNKSLWDDAVTLQKPHHAQAIYGDKFASGPDTVAQAAYEAHQIKEPSAGALWQAIDAASKKRANVFDALDRQNKAFDAEVKEHEDWIKATKKGEVRVSAGQLGVGDFMEVNGEHVEVVDVDPDTGDVTIKDGKKFGVQKLPDGKSIHVEKFTPGQDNTDFLPPDAPNHTHFSVTIDGEPWGIFRNERQAKMAASGLEGKVEIKPVDLSKLVEPTPADIPADNIVPFPKAETPKLRPGEKGTGDLLQGGDAPFNLAGEKAVDAERIAKEKADAERVKKEAAELEKKQQGDLPGTERQGAIATAGQQLAPSAPVPSKTPKSQRVIIADLAKGLKLPIRFGRLRTNKYAGYFLKVQNLIGSKKANDIPIVSHEVGHKLDAEFGFASNPALRAELDHLGDPSVPGSRSSWTPTKGTRYKLGEGVAEFVRHWLTDPPTARTMAPNTHAFFESVLNANKDFGDVMRQAQDDIQVWKTAEQQARLRSHISVGENPNKTRYSLSQLTRDLIDDLHFARLAVDDAEKYSGHTLAPSRNPYLLARNLRGSYGMADQFVRHGIADFNSRAVTLGTSLEDALKPVAGRMNDFRDWIVAKRAEELHAQGRNTGLVPADVAFTAAKFNAEPAFNAAFAKIKAWNDGLLKYAVDSGMVTPEAAKAMRQMNQDYVPFHRVFEIGAGESPAAEGAGTGRGLNVGTPASLRKMTGSPRDIVDPIETMVKNAYSLITASEKFAINRAVADLSRMPNMGQWVEHVKTPQQRITVGIEKLRQELVAAGADLTSVPDDTLLHFFQNSGGAPFGENMISVTRDGKPEFYRLKKELFETFHALNLDDAGTLLKALSSPAQLLRAGVTLAPDFALANAMRDAFSSAIISKHGLFPFEAALKGAAAMIQNPKLVAEWKASGGENAIEANYFDRTKLQHFLREKITKDLTPAEQALVVVKSPITALRWLTGTFEEITRIGEYKTAFEDLTAKGMPEGEARRLAAYESRDRQDFAKGGAKTKILRHATAFWNAQLQAQVKLFQAMKENPGRTALAGLAFITIPKLMEQAVNWNDKDYWDRPQWERDLFFLIPIGKGKDGHTSFLRIPTPFEPGIIFGTLPGRALQSLHQKDPAALKSFPSLALRQGIPDPIPQAAQALFADFLSGKKGWDIWRGRTVVPESLAQLPPDMQWTEQTSLTAKKLGKVLNFSPMKIDHIIAQSSGGLGRQVVNQVADRAIEATGGGKRTAAGTVLGGRFFTTPAAVSSDSVEQFYATLDDLRTQIAGAKHGSKDPVDRQWASIFEARSRALGALRKVIRSTANPDEKAAKQEQLLQLARKTMEEYRAAKAK